MRKSIIYELIFVIIIIFLGLLIKDYFNDEIKSRRQTSEGKITKIWVTKKPVFTRLEYSYVIGRDTFHTFYDADNGVEYNRLIKLEGKSVMLVYDSLNPKSNRLLITESDFKKYDVVYPDSMKWLKEIIGE